MLNVVPYQSEWPGEFRVIGTRLRRALGPLALRIDHIGSTSVPGLAAKDLIDIQVTVDALSSDVEAAMADAGMVRSRHTSDHLPPGANPDPALWAKLLYKTPEHERPANVHVRLKGGANQRYALLFRDYLRAFPAVAEAYAQVKIALKRHHPEADQNVYYEVKDPVCDIIYSGAELWARTTGWTPGESDC